MQISAIGLDLAKNVFQVYSVDNEGRTVLQKRLWRGDVLTFFTKLSSCLLGMEACASTHYWARELAKHGHEVRLIPPTYVKPYVNRSSTGSMMKFVIWPGMP